VPAVCFAGNGEDDKTSYNEVEECEQRENLESAELGTALTSFDAFSVFLYPSVECLLAKIILEPEQTCYCAVGSRAPPLGC